eukprot:m.87957 g.87957  ORF g.87957 m.87957 type:complete len:190 (-) comp14521_c2_seq1:268-837(-)
MLLLMRYAFISLFFIFVLPRQYHITCRCFCVNHINFVYSFSTSLLPPAPPPFFWFVSLLWYQKETMPLGHLYKFRGPLDDNEKTALAVTGNLLRNKADGTMYYWDNTQGTTLTTTGEWVDWDMDAIPTQFERLDEHMQTKSISERQAQAVADRAKAQEKSRPRTQDQAEAQRLATEEAKRRIKATQDQM